MPRVLLQQSVGGGLKLVLEWLIVLSAGGCMVGAEFASSCASTTVHRDPAVRPKGLWAAAAG
jgi:hypothetical protein